jgi:hypothetical protein
MDIVNTNEENNNTNNEDIVSENNENITTGAENNILTDAPINATDELRALMEEVPNIFDNFPF